MIPYSFACSAVRMLSRSVSTRIFSGVWTGVTGQDLVEALADPLDLGRLDLQVRHLPLEGATGTRLVDQDGRVGQRRTLAGRTAGQQDRRRRRRLAEADGHDVAVHVLHRVVDGEHVGHAAAGRVDVHRDVAVGILALQDQQLRHHVVGDGLVDGRADEDDALLEQLRVRGPYCRWPVGVCSMKLGRM